MGSLLLKKPFAHATFGELRQTYKGETKLWYEKMYKPVVHVPNVLLQYHIVDVLQQ